MLRLVGAYSATGPKELVKFCHQNRLINQNFYAVTLLIVFRHYKDQVRTPPPPHPPSSIVISS